MSRPRVLRLLRIAVSAVCAIPCLLVIMSWVRSCSFYDCWDLCSGGTFMLRVGSRNGVVLFAPWVFSNRPSNPQAGFTHHKILFTQLKANNALIGRPLKKWSPWKYSKHNYPSGDVERDLFLPYWFLAMAAGLLPAAPWLPWSWRFSLRTLLLATSLVAVVLALIVALR
jgi:hypothetical protein